MVSYRVVPFHPRGFDRGEGRRGRDVEDVSAFREWIEDKGDSFTQTAPGSPGESLFMRGPGASLGFWSARRELFVQVLQVGLANRTNS